MPGNWIRNVTFVGYLTAFESSSRLAFDRLVLKIHFLRSFFKKAGDLRVALHEELNIAFART
jgi:hypothetical protein